MRILIIKLLKLIFQEQFLHQVFKFGPGSVVNSSLPHSYKVGYMAGYSRAAVVADVTSQQDELGTSVPMWCVRACELALTPCLLHSAVEHTLSS